ncbi:hypothetical protein HA402_014724 [Bradysia odoriphaga]|nr:hypothetical protein HA402_014724 [Bradysia odoriphaga]
MAMQLKTISNKLLSPTVNLMRNYSRFSVPSIFFEDPFRRHRQLFSDYWNAPFDALAQAQKMQKLMDFRMPSMNDWEGEQFVCNPKDGFHVSLNVEHFAPNEISVRVIDKSILVEAKHEERAENGESYASRHFTRRFVLPDEFSEKDIVSTLSSDGILSVRVPPKEIDPQNARNIHIQQTGTPARNLGQKPTLNQNQNEPKK